jgi:hypothetical protein
MPLTMHIILRKRDVWQCCGSGIRCLFDPGIRDGKKTGSGSGINNPDHISESIETNFWVKILKFFDTDPGSGIWDGKHSDQGSGIRNTDVPYGMHNFTLGEIRIKTKI